MIRSTRRAALMFALVCVLAPTVAVGQRYPVRTYTEVDGLPSAGVRAVSQDQDGLLWFATRAGVASYDGAHWVAYGRSEGLPAVDHSFLEVDSEGVKWAVASVTPIRVSRFDGEQWQPLPPVTTTPGTQWLASAAVMHRGETTYILANPEGGDLFLWDGDRWSEVLYRRRTAAARTIAVDDGRFLIASDEGLLQLRPEPGSEATPVAGSPKLPIRGMAPDGEAIWVVGEDWIGRIESGRFRRVRELDLGFLPNYVGAHVTPDPQGGIYIGNASALTYYHPEVGAETIDRSSGLIAGGATDLLIDREDNLWITGMRGVTKILHRRFVGFDRDQGLYADEVSAVLERQDGTIVLGQPNGLTLMEEVPRKIAFPADDLRGRVLDLTESEDGTVWIAGTWLGLGSLDDNGRLSWHQPEGGWTSSVQSVLSRPGGRVWIATDSGLYVRQRGRIDPYLLPTDVYPQPHRVRKLIGGKQGTVYALTRGQGVFRIEGDEVEVLSHPTDEEANNVYALLEREDGTVLVGSGIGLYRRAGAELELVEEPRIDRPVYFIIEDSAGKLWIGTDNGVFRYAEGRLDHFTVPQGLIGAETNRAAGLVDSRGRVWVGTDRGVSVYRPLFDTPRRHPPAAEFLSVSAGNETLVQQATVRVPHDANELVFDFRAIAFVDESRVQFRYRLDGLDDGWRGPEPLPLRQVRYTSLSPGDYTLHLQVVDSEGRVSDTVTSSSVTIRPPFWLRAWFLSLLALVALGSVYGVVRYSAQQRYARQLEIDVRRRTEELALSEATLAADRQRLAVTLGNITDGVLATDADGRIVVWNASATRITGATLAEATGRHLTEVLVASGGDGGFSELVTSDLRVDRNCTIVAVGGAERTLELSSAPIGDGSGFVVAFRDITEKQRLESELVQAQKLESLGILAGGIAHDFNNLLMAILGNLSLIEASGDSAESRQTWVRNARAAALKSRSLTQQLLTFSRGGAPVRHAASIIEVIRESVRLCLSGAKATCDVDLPEDLGVVEIDEGQISQVLHNLLINARQALPEGGTIRVRARNVDDVPAPLTPGHHIVIEVRDDGPGIPEQNLSRVFDPYFSTKETGTGLGLASAYSIVSKHEGLLTVESVDGEGASFRIYLPRTDKSVPRGASESAVAGGPVRVLMMDDDEGVRRVVSQILDARGFPTTTAADGEEAIRLFSEARDHGEPFDVVIMDLTVPGGMGGVETLRRLQQIDDDVCAVAVSGYSNDPVIARFGDYGFRAGLGKPFEASELLDSITRVAGETTGDRTGQG